MKHSALPVLLSLGLAAPAQASDCYGTTNVKAGPYCDNPISELQSASGSRKVNIPNPYRQPVVLDSSLKDMGMNCQQLQREINYLQKMTYTYKPNPYNDAINGASVLGGTFVAWPLFAGLGWTTYIGHQENKRIADAQDQIEELRRLKAERHCFECEGRMGCP